MEVLLWYEEKSPGNEKKKKKTNPQILSNFLDSFLSEPNCIVQWWKHSTKHLPSSHSQHCFVIENNAASKQPKALISVLYSQYHVDLLPLVVCARAAIVNVWGHEWWAGGAARGRYVGVQPTVVFEQMLLSFQGPEQLNAIVKDLRSRCDTVCFCCATESLGVFCVIFMLFFSCRIVLDMEDK